MAGRRHGTRAQRSSGDEEEEEEEGRRGPAGRRAALPPANTLGAALAIVVARDVLCVPTVELSN
jgi:hypothetical protein